MRKWYLIIFFLLTFTHAYAAMRYLPAAIKIENNLIILPGSAAAKVPQVYFLKNKSQTSIWIDHPLTKNPGVSAGFSSYLRGGNWSAFVLNKQNFALSCLKIQPGKVVTMNCKQILDVFTPLNWESLKPLKGSYWLTEDKADDAFIKALAKRGFFPK